MPAATSLFVAGRSRTSRGASASAIQSTPTAPPPCCGPRGDSRIATSATYERGAHIIDPSTGEATAAVASVTVVGPDLTFADAYATAVFVMGIDGLVWLHTTHPDYGGFVITHDGQTLSTPEFDRHR